MLWPHGCSPAILLCRLVPVMGSGWQPQYYFSGLCTTIVFLHWDVKEWFLAYTVPTDCIQPSVQAWTLSPRMTVVLSSYPESYWEVHLGLKGSAKTAGKKSCEYFIPISSVVRCLKCSVQELSNVWNRSLWFYNNKKLLRISSMDFFKPLFKCCSVVLFHF